MIELNKNEDSISPGELKQRLDSGKKIFVMDVREPHECQDWYIKGSVNMPLSSFNIRNLNIPKGMEIVTICAHGMRSEAVRRQLVANGYRAKSMRGGMVAWNSVYDVAEVPVEAKFGKVKILQLRRVGKGCLSYVLISETEAVVIDPNMYVERYLDAVKGVKIVGVVDTHVHADHVSGGLDLAKKVGVPYFVPDEINGNVEHERVNEGSKIKFGNASLSSIATPGHTPGSMTYSFGKFLFTGDTLFVESVGRPDLLQDARANGAVLWASIHGKLLSLPKETLVLPGHYSDAVELRKNIPVDGEIRELEKNIKALGMGKEEFVDWIVKNTVLKPTNYETIKRFNKRLVRIDDFEELVELEAGSNRCAVRSE